MARFIQQAVGQTHKGISSQADEQADELFMADYSCPNLFRMQQFYDAYKKASIVSPLLRQLRH